jgi:glycosyltransferase involved in cell wall biosynthesis
VSVITPTVTERALLLRECKASVRSQTFPEWEHLILEDTERHGCSVTVNELVRAAAGEYLFLLADDDMLLPGCLEHHLRERADVVYSPPLVWGEDSAQFHGGPPNIPSSSLIKASTWRALGGYDERRQGTEDMDFYQRALERQASFVRIEYPCWIYRFHGANKSRVPA